MGAVWSLLLFQKHYPEPEAAIVDLQGSQTVQTHQDADLRHRLPDNASREEEGPLYI